MLVHLQTPAGATKGNPVELFVTVGVLVVTVVIGTMVVLYFRRRWMAKQAESESPTGFMESLREMRASGKISEEEFAATKAKLSARLREGVKGLGGLGGGAAVNAAASAVMARDAQRARRAAERGVERGPERPTDPPQSPPK